MQRTHRRKIENIKNFVSKHHSLRQAKGYDAKTARLRIRYLLGDQFPYPDVSYTGIRVGLLNRAIWNTTCPVPGIPKLTPEELLGVAFCPRVIPLDSLQALNLTWTYALLRKIPSHSSFRRETELDVLQEQLAQLAIQNKGPEAFARALRRPSMLPVICAQAEDTIRLLKAYPLNPNCYTHEHLIVDLARALEDEDEWWRAIQIAELVFRAKILDGYDPGAPLITIGQLYTGIVEKMWNLVAANLGHTTFNNPSFCFPKIVSVKTISSPKPQPVVTESQHERSLLHDQA
jgi:hypothetical protein